MSVFISYRRDGGKRVAEAIYQALNDEYDIFLDTESLKNGYFDSAIEKKIYGCSDFLVIITDTVFDRCTEPGDWIFREAQIALHEHKNVIPIFVGTQKFPSNVPEVLKEICRFNGIFWSDEIETCEKIKSFLISNRRYILSAVRCEDRIVLTADSKEELKGLYRRFSKKGRNPVDIEISVSDTDELSELLIRKDIVEQEGHEVARYCAKQDLLRRIKLRKEALEIAVEYMLQDKMIEGCADRLQEFYIEKYGGRSCVFTDEEGSDIYLYTPFLWIDIIEEMLQEILYNRVSYYIKSGNYKMIDCIFKSEIWYFSSFVSKRSDEEAYLKLMELLSIPRGRGGYMDIPLHSLAFHVYPDFFYNIGMLKAGKTVDEFEKVNNHKDVFNLRHYFFGLH